MNKQNNDLGWVKYVHKTLQWFIESMGEEEWHRRRRGVADYFQSLKEKQATEPEILSKGFENLFDPIAVYDDWIAWYMYLVECVFERPGCDDPFQSSRIYPFFLVIGKDIAALKRMEGIEKRLLVMFNEKQNKPDSTLYELTVALLYHRNGWDVKFLTDHSSRKTPDLEVHKNGNKYWVECKRLSKVNEYAEKERKEWLKRSIHLFNAMRIAHLPAYAEIVFKVPIEDTDEVILGAAFTAYLKHGMLEKGKILSNKQIDFKAKPLDIPKINSYLNETPTRPNSPHMIKLLTGEFSSHGNYTPLLAPHRIDSVNPDDELFILNEFYGEIATGYVAKWDCIAEQSINGKAKSITKTLSKALSQIPEEGKGIIHIGYETVTGPDVEIQRHKKIKQGIDEFAFGSKQITAIYCNTMQFFSNPEGVDWAETTIFFEDETILENNLLFNLPSTDSDITHWEEDAETRDRSFK